MIARRGHWFQTWSGRRFFPAHPLPEDVSLEDIAHSLAHQCRFAGHVRSFYSIAQHSVLVSRLVPGRLALHGLLHDAAEAYTGDLISPMKRELRGLSLDGRQSDYDWIEHRVDRAVRQHFGLPELGTADEDAVKHADLQALATERRDLLRDAGHAWDCIERVPPDPSPIVPLAPAEAHASFLARFAEVRPARR